MKSTIPFFVLFAIIFVSGCKRNDEVVTDSPINEFMLMKMENYLLASQDDPVNVRLAFENIDKVNPYSVYALEVRNCINSDKNAQMNKDSKIPNLPQLPKCFANPLTEGERLMFVLILKTIKGKSTVQKMTILNSLDQFIKDNLCESNQQERMLYFTGTLKIVFTQKNNTTGSSVNDIKSKAGKFDLIAGLKEFEDCMDVCMCNKYDSYNFIDWVGFCCNPVGDVLWNEASCAWDCF